MQLQLNPQHTPHRWIATVIDHAKPFAAVMPGFIWATLRRRFPSHLITDYPIIPPRSRTPQIESFGLATTVFHITAAASAHLMRLCVIDHRAGRLPFVLVPRAAVEQAKLSAARSRVAQQVMVNSLEDFVEFKVIMLGLDEGRAAFDIFTDILALYNQRQVDQHADASLHFELN